MKKLRLFIVINETPFHHPKYIKDFINRTRDEIVGVAVVTHAPQVANLEKYLFTHIYRLKINELQKLAFVALQAKLHRIPTVTHILKNYEIPFFEVNKNINRPEYLHQIKMYNPDIIISSNPWIFKQKLLSLPNITCINRHSGLLPSYAGLLPVFHAMAHAEKYTGVTIHTMTAHIDQGIILSQKKIKLNYQQSLNENYGKTFQDSVDATLEAIDKLKKTNQTPSLTNKFLPSYYSLPSSQDWKNFRNNQGRFI